MVTFFFSSFFCTKKKKNRESIVGFIGKDFEVYAVLSPLAFMPLIVDCLDRIIIWSKRKEPILFALDKSTW